MGNTDDLDKRHRLEERKNETLGWTGLGHCDGGSIGSGTMEVCNFVVDFEIAKKVIEEDLIETQLSDFARIYDENAEICEWLHKDRSLPRGLGGAAFGHMR